MRIQCCHKDGHVSAFLRRRNVSQHYSRHGGQGNLRGALLNSFESHDGCLGSVCFDKFVGDRGEGALSGSQDFQKEYYE